MGSRQTILILLTAVMAVYLLSGCAILGGRPSPENSVGAAVPAHPAPPESVAVSIDLRYADGMPVNGVQREVVPLGSTVELKVSGDPPGPVHLRGYERYAEVLPGGGPGVLRFTADMAGVFALEFDRLGQQLALIEVLGAPGTG